MKVKIVYLLSFLSVMGFMISCDTIPEALSIQNGNPYTYDDQYYQDLRDYKASDHQLCFVWFSDYAKNTSMSNRFAGLPDSIDIVSLWGSMPSMDKNPLAYTEMRHMQKVKGTKMVIPTIIRIEHAGAYRDEEFYQMFQDSYISPVTDEKLAMRNKALEMYADYLLKDMWDNDLDGLDLDFEPEGDRLDGANMSYFVKYLGGIIGPMSPNPDKLLIIDFYGHYPPQDTEPYANYFVRQAYTQGFTEHSAARLQGYTRDWIPPHKFIVTENIGDHWQNGGSPFTEADGNTLNSKGERLYSLEGMARWNPTQGQKAGFGAFFVQRDYSSNPPYKHLRNGIQAQNPAVK